MVIHLEILSIGIIIIIIKIILLYGKRCSKTYKLFI